MKSNSHTRDTWMDVLRILCCFMIIMLHTSAQIEAIHTWTAVQTIVRPALWTFMALTGYYIFDKRISSLPDFWFHRLSNLLIPVMIYLPLYYIVPWNTLGSYSLLAFFQGDPIGHLWYVHTLIEIILLVPLLQRGIEVMSGKRLLCILITYLIVSRVIRILVAGGIQVGFHMEIIGAAGLFYVLLGRYLKKHPFNKLIPLIIVMLLNCCVIFWIFRNHLLVEGAAELSLVMAVGTTCYICIFRILNDRIPVGPRLSRVIFFFSRRTYGVYLIHMLFLQFFISHSIFSYETVSKGKLMTTLGLESILIFILSLCISCILDLTLVRLILKLFGKVYELLKALFCREVRL